MKLPHFYPQHHDLTLTIPLANEVVTYTLPPNATLEFDSLFLNFVNFLGNAKMQAHYFVVDPKGLHKVIGYEGKIPLEVRAHPGLVHENLNN